MKQIKDETRFTPVSIEYSKYATTMPRGHVFLEFTDASDGFGFTRAHHFDVNGGINIYKREKRIRFFQLYTNVYFDIYLDDVLDVEEVYPMKLDGGDGIHGPEQIPFMYDGALSLRFYLYKYPNVPQDERHIRRCCCQVCIWNKAAIRNILQVFGDHPAMREFITKRLL